MKDNKKSEENSNVFLMNNHQLIRENLRLKQRITELESMLNKSYTTYNGGNALEYKRNIIDIESKKKAEKKILEWAKMLQRVIDLLPIRVYWKDKDLKYLGGNIIFANDNNLMHPKELIGKGENDLKCDENINSYSNEDKQILVSGVPKINVVNSYTDIYGKKRWLKTSKVPLTNVEGKVIGIIGTYEDITDIKKWEEELIKSHDEYRLFFENDLTGDFISSADGILLDCNPSFIDIMGFPSKREAIGSNLINLYQQPDTRIKILELLNKNKKINNHEYEMLRFDGRPIHLISNIFGIFNESADLVQIQGYVFDNTEKKIALDKIRKLSRAVEQSPAAIVITDLEGNIEYVNQKYLQTTKYSPEEVIGKNASIQKSGHTSIEEYKKLWNTINSGNEWSGEFLNKKKDGSLYWESALISPIRNHANKITHFLAVKEDITEKKEYEQKLIIAKDRAEESDRLKTAFLNTMSHELRTPLNAIIGFSGLVTEKSSIKKVIQFNKYIYQSGIQLEKIIENMFEFSSIEAGLTKLLKEEIKLKNFFIYLHEVIHAEQIKRKKNNIQLLFNHQDADLSFSADKNKLSQVLINLLVNALKFTIAGSIEMGFWLENGRDLIFFVKDSGIGIPRNMFKKIFERFTQVDINSMLSIEGIGLGLTISSKLVELMGGHIWVESVLGKGSKFYVSIPNCLVNEKSNTINNKNLKLQYDFSKTNILIVEDVARNYIFLEHLLKKYNANIYWAQNGKEAIDMVIQNRKIDIILMDLKIPVINGFEATKKIKISNPEIPVFAISAQVTKEDIKKASMAGCNEFISKPIDSKQLLNKLHKYLKN